MTTKTRLSLLLLAAAISSAVLAPAAHAAPCDQRVEGTFGVAQGCFDGAVAANPAGDAFTQAGGVPYSLTVGFEMNTRVNPDVFPKDRWPVEPVKDTFVDSPPGLIGNPAAVTQCAMGELAEIEPEGSNCPTSSQVGQAVFYFNTGEPPFPSPARTSDLAIYAMQPPPGVPARFGLQAFGTIVVLDGELRSDGDYGIRVASRDISEGLAVLGGTFKFWGTPASSAHDGERACPGVSNQRCTTEAPLRSFLRLPTACTAQGQGLTTTLSADSWFHPGVFDTASFESHLPPGLLSDPEQRDPEQWGAPQGPTGCAGVPFDPAISVQPTVHAADSPTGLDVDLTLPQTDDPAAINTSDLKRAVVTLPQGMSVNPSGADGLGACTSAQIGLLGTDFPAPNPIHFSKAEPACPDNSKIGIVTIDTPLLDHQVHGSVYLAAQQDNPFGSLLAMYVVADDPQDGVVIKLPGYVQVGLDGQLTTTFDNQPQLPFEKLHLEFFGGPRAALRTPATCGTKTTEAQLSPWARPDSPVSLSDSFQVTSGPGGAPCAGTDAQRPFGPTMSAGTESNTAGSFSPFQLRLSRADGSQELSGLSVSLPQGLIGKPAGVPYCSQAQLDSIPTGDSSLGLGAAQLAGPSCPSASQVGTVTVGAGAGTNPFYVQTGKAYLAGPYKGAPLSMAIVTPAVAGPFDLGNVVVRTALNVNPETAQLTAVSDPLPTALQGIPLDLRDVRVDLSRPDFTLNPTSCAAKAIGAHVSGASGAQADLSTRFQAADCASLGFKPKLALRFSGPTHRSAHPKLRAVLTMPKGDANIGRAAVTLPSTEFLENAHIQTICTRVQYAAHACPAKSIYGYAKAWSPLLDQPLAGPVYLRSSSHELPDLVASLDGQIHVDVAGKIDSVHARIRNTFEAVPDAPVSKFVLTMQGGKKGLLVNNTELCKATPRATALFDGQNGKVHDIHPLVKTDCGKQARENGRR